jgi:hypothetical protein
VCELFGGSNVGYLLAAAIELFTGSDLQYSTNIFRPQCLNLFTGSRVNLFAGGRACMEMSVEGVDVFGAEAQAYHTGGDAAQDREML